MPNAIKSARRGSGPWRHMLALSMTRSSDRDAGLCLAYISRLFWPKYSPLVDPLWIYARSSASRPSRNRARQDRCVSNHVGSRRSCGVWRAPMASKGSSTLLSGRRSRAVTRQAVPHAADGVIARDKPGKLGHIAGNRPITVPAARHMYRAQGRASSHAFSYEGLGCRSH